MITILQIHTHSQGLLEITEQVQTVLTESGADSGLCTVFIRHTSASLLIQENADPSAKRDLERWFNRLVPEGDKDFTHTYEGPDDMPSHIKAALSATSLAIPFENNQLLLGTWQGVYLWEHRRQAHRRQVVVHILQG